MLWLMAVRTVCQNQQTTFRQNQTKLKVKKCMMAYLKYWFRVLRDYFQISMTLFSFYMYQNLVKQSCLSVNIVQQAFRQWETSPITETLPAFTKLRVRSGLRACIRSPAYLKMPNISYKYKSLMYLLGISPISSNNNSTQKSSSFKLTVKFADQ